MKFHSKRPRYPSRVHRGIAIDEINVDVDDLLAVINGWGICQ